MSSEAINARIDVRLGSLTGEVAPRNAIASRDPGTEYAPTFYLETFGCQMNDHDSEKVAGVLLGRGYRQVEKPDDAGVVLYNTCSIREKAASKVFSRLGLFRTRLRKREESLACWVVWRSRKAKLFSIARRGLVWFAVRPATVNCRK